MPNKYNIYFIGNSRLLDKENTYNNATVEECLEYFKEHTHIAIDTETEGRDPYVKKIISIQIGDAKRQYVIDLRVIPIKLFKNLLESKICIFHNAKFDYKFIKMAGITVEKIYDTMLAECILAAGYDKFGYGLADLAKRYLNIDLDKSTRGDFYKLKDNEFTDKQIEYAGLDVAYLHDIMHKQMVLIKKYDLEYCLNLENNVVKALADIELNGVEFDKIAWIQNCKKYEIKLNDLTKQLDEIVIKDSKLNKIYKPKYVQSNLFGYEERMLTINYASPSQTLKMFHELGYKVDSTDSRELEKLTTKHEFFKVLNEYREVAKVISTYGQGFLDYINKHTGRIHTNFWQILRTGRVSSGEKGDKYDKGSPNMQNIPADNKFRNCFITRPGFMWVSIDYSGQELRLMADGSGENGFIDVLNTGEDLHCYAGSMMYGKTITKADKELRNQAKTINFGKAYGMGPRKLADQLNISIEKALELFEQYEKAFPVLNNWLKKQGDFAVKHCYSVTFSPCKRRRWYPEMASLKEFPYDESDTEAQQNYNKVKSKTQRDGANSPIQGSGADICKEALVGIRNLILSYNKQHNTEVAYLINTVHDAIDVEVKKELAEEFAKEMADIMVKCGNKYVKKVKMEVDITITEKWQK